MVRFKLCGLIIVYFNIIIDIMDIILFFYNMKMKKKLNWKCIFLINLFSLNLLFFFKLVVIVKFVFIKLINN